MLRILVLDDDPGMLHLVAELLRDADLGAIDVRLAGSAAAAREALRAAPADVVLADYLLGAEDGVQFARELRSEDPEAVVVLLTGYADPELEATAAAAGLAHLLPKGELDSAALGRVIRAATQQRSG